MRKVNTQNLKPWKKGESGNPQGGKRHNKAVKKIKKLTIDEVSDVVSLVVKKNVQALEDIIRDPQASVLRVWTASIAVKAIRKGDFAAWNALISRICGNVPNKIEATGKDGSPLNPLNPTVVILPSNGREAK